MFINTVLIPLFINYDEENWFTRTGLVTDVFFNLIGVAFLSPLIYIFSPGYLYKLFIRYREKKKGSGCKLTQAQLNELYEGQNVDLAQRYAITMLMLLLC